MKTIITVQVLNGATGEVSEVVANVQSECEQSAVEKLFAIGRRDDYYYRYLGSNGVLSPIGSKEIGFPRRVSYSGMDYFGRE